MVSVKLKLFISSGWWASGSCLLDIRRVVVFLYIKVTSQSYSKTLIVSRTELRKKAAVCGSSMNMYMRVASAIRRIVYNIINVNQ